MAMMIVNLAIGLATIYYPGDGFSGKHKADGTAFVMGQNHIAHRKLPLGTEGWVCSLKSGICYRTVVRDRGPYGAIRKCSEGVGSAKPYVSATGFHPIRKIRWKGSCYYWQSQHPLSPGWRYRGEFDITRRVAKKIKMRAFDRVIFVRSHVP